MLVLAVYRSCCILNEFFNHIFSKYLAFTVHIQGHTKAKVVQLDITIMSGIPNQFESNWGRVLISQVDCISTLIKYIALIVSLHRDTKIFMAFIQGFAFEHRLIFGDIIKAYRHF